MCTDESLSIFFNDNIDDIQRERGVEGLCQSGKTTVISCRARKKRRIDAVFLCVVVDVGTNGYDSSWREKCRKESGKAREKRSR